MANPLVSVVIPVYNGEKYLREAIQSVLDQTYSNVELIVVDDGSIDNTPKIIHDFASAIRSIRQDNQGTSTAINRGFEMAQGEFLAINDADDVWVDDKLVIQVAALMNDPTLDMVFGMVEHFHSPELSEKDKRKIYCPPDPVPGILAGTVLMRRSAFERVGQLDGRWEVGEFVDWCARAMEMGLKQRIVPDVVCRRRLHTTNKMIVQRERYGDLARIMKASLDRRRQKANEGAGDE